MFYCFGQASLNQLQGLENTGLKEATFGKYLPKLGLWHL